MSAESQIGLSPELLARIQEALRSNPSRMTLQLARELEVPEVEVIRAFSDNRAVELDIARWEELLRAPQQMSALTARRSPASGV